MSKTVQQVKTQFEAEGKTVVEWARQNGFSIYSVRAVLAGHNKGRRGQAHRIAVALALKEQPK